MYMWWVLETRGCYRPDKKDKGQADKSGAKGVAAAAGGKESARADSVIALAQKSSAKDSRKSNQNAVDGAHGSVLDQVQEVEPAPSQEEINLKRRSASLFALPINVCKW